MRRAILVCALLLLPSTTFAASFAKQSLFLSKSSVIEGDTVLIHSVVSNDTTTRFSGTLVLRDDATTIGSVPVTLGAGEANTLSVSWKPSAGSQAVRAQITTTDGVVVETQSATFVIAEKPKPAATHNLLLTASASNGADSSEAIQNSIESVSPAVANATAPVFNSLDSFREAGTNVLDTQIATTKAKLGNKGGSVLGAETKKNSATDTALTIFETLYLYVLTIVRYIFSKAGVFYPILAFIFLFILYRLYRRMTRRPWER